MSFMKVYVHYVWSTKNKEPLLSADISPDVFNHIRENARKKNIFIDFINGYIDHNYKSQILNPILVWAKARFLLFIF